MADIEIEIDGQKLTANPTQTVIQVADAAGIYIPRFCYHKHLSIPANCRMCLVEVEKAPKTVPACATPCTPGMKVFTKSPKTLAAQRAVMEFLLINHPLDCPICDQGGECELQDLAMGYGQAWSHYDECKRSIADEDLGPLVATNMTRCIQCTRCVRFGEEIAGLRELGVTFRGENEQISTYVEQAIKSEVSGNIIDLCPVGALTSKPYRFTARPWELDQSPSIAPHDCLGTNLNIHTRYGKVMRVVSRENSAINETWISDRDRFSYTGLYAADRLEAPLARIDGEWQTVEWQHAFQLIADQLQAIKHEFGADSIGALASPNSTLEEFYLLQKIMRGIGSNNIDHRLREVDTQDQSQMQNFPGLPMPIANLENCDAIVLIGANIQKDQPLLGLRIRKASLKGATVIAINPVDYQFNFNVTAQHVAAPHAMVAAVAMVLKSLQGNTEVDANIKSLSDSLKNKKNICILLGGIALHHAEASALRYYAQQIAEATGAQLGFLTDGVNAAGAWLAGAIPHRHPAGSAIDQAGLNAYQMLSQPLKAYLLLNVEPEFDTANAAQATAALQQAKFTVALSVYQNEVLKQYANVILPIAPFTETAGTFINVTGEWQSFKGIAQPIGSSRPAWKILRVLGNFLHLDGFGFESAEEVKHEVKGVINSMTEKNNHQFALPKPTNPIGLSRIGEIPLYALDSLVRRAQPLQKTQRIVEGNLDCVRVHSETAKKLNVNEGDIVLVKQATASAELPIAFDNRIAIDAVWIAGGLISTATLGDLFGEVSLQKLS